MGGGGRVLISDNEPSMGYCHQNLDGGYRLVGSKAAGLNADILFSTFWRYFLVETR